MLMEVIYPSHTGWLGTVVQTRVGHIPIGIVKVQIAELIRLVHGRRILEYALTRCVYENLHAVIRK